MDESWRFRSIRIRGRVQGVGFRWWSRGVATELGLTGGVWNERDGSVRVDVAGPPDMVQAFVDRLSEGPLGSRVDGLDELEAEAPFAVDGFEILRHGRR